jgi:hypothetical protein
VRSVPRSLDRAVFDHRGQAYERLKKRTGCKCEACGAQCCRPLRLEADLPAYRIVHQDGNGKNYDDDNLALFCEHCYRDRYQHRMGR